MSDLHAFGHHAMATPWTIQVAGEDENSAAWVAENAFAIVDRLEQDLSRFQASSYICQLERLPKGQRLRVSRETHECLELAKAVWHETSGAFDITVQLERSADWISQMEGFALCENNEIEVLTDGLKLDLGGIGKGFALDEIAQWLHENEIAHAFLDSGGSTFLAVGAESPDAEGWPASLGTHGAITLSNQALSASGFEVQGYHVIDPRTGQPVQTERQRAWVMAGSAALADALSTSALVLSDKEIATFSAAHPEVTVMLK